MISANIVWCFNYKYNTILLKKDYPNIIPWIILIKNITMTLI